MEWSYSLVGGHGRVDIRQEGDRAVCRVVLADDGRGLYKAYLTGRGGRLLLGTLLPEDGRLALARILPVADLDRRGLWPPAGAAAELSFPFRREPSPTPPGWIREERPGRLMGDALLSQAASALKGVLLWWGEEGFRLALPYRPEAPFPLTPLFCFAHPAVLGGQPHIIFSFNRKGCPIFPHKEKMSGETNGVNHTKE